MADDPPPASELESAARRQRVVRHVRREGAKGRFYRRLGWGLLGAALLGVLGYASFHFLKPVRARHLAQQAVAAFGRHDLERGRTALNSALKLAPNDPTVLRLTARLLTAAGSPEGLKYWQRLFSLEAGPEADHRAYLELALRFDRVALAWPELTNLLQAHPNEVALLHRGVRLFLTTQSLEDAETWARRAWRIAPQEATNQLILGEVLLQSQPAAKQDEGRRLLVPLALGHGLEQINAARLLADAPRLERAERTQIARALRERVPTSPEIRLLAAQLDLPVESKPRTVALDAIIREFGQEDALRPKLADWLLQRDAPAQALIVLPADRALTNSVWLALRLEALAKNRSWDELAATLGRPNLPLPPLIAHVFTGWRLTATGQPREGEGSFLQAIRAAPSTTALADPLRFVALQAEIASMPAVAVTAWIQRMENPSLAISSGREAVRLLAGLDDEPRLRDVLRRLRDLLPDDPSVAGEWACVSVMLNAEVTNAHERLVEVHRLRPENVSYRLALAKLRLGHAAEALAVVDEAPVDWAALLPRDRVAYIAVLAANQQRAVARQFAAKLDPLKLKTAERALLQQALARE